MRGQANESADIAQGVSVWNLEERANVYSFLVR